MSTVKSAVSHPSIPLTRAVVAWSDVSAAAALFFIGVVLVLLAGFAGPSSIHNAAHDARHSFAFACH